MEKKVFVHDGIVSSGIYHEIDYMRDYREAFRSEFLNHCNVDWYCYLSDMICDGLDLTCSILNYKDNVIPNYLIEKINKWYMSCEALLYDIRIWLYNECDIKNTYDYIENYKSHKLVRKLNKRGM